MTQRPQGFSISLIGFIDTALKIITKSGLPMKSGKPDRAGQYARMARTSPMQRRYQTGYCQNPRQIEERDAEGNYRYVRCGDCPGCYQNNFNTYRMKGLGETMTHPDMWAITLTYRDGEEGALYLRPDDYKRFMKRIRKAGYKLRYLIVGEYGGKKGRPHWHAILWWNLNLCDNTAHIGEALKAEEQEAKKSGELLHYRQLVETRIERIKEAMRGKPKNSPENRARIALFLADRMIPDLGEPLPGQRTRRDSELRRENRFWPHGHVTIDATEYNRTAVEYVLKYILKGEAFKVASSNGLGSEYFLQRARIHGKAGKLDLRNWHDVTLQYTGLKSKGSASNPYRGPQTKYWWQRTREVSLGAYHDAGHVLPEDPQYSSYQNILTPEDRSEFEQEREDRLDRESVSRIRETATDHKTIRSKAGHVLRTFRRGAQHYMDLTGHRAQPWMTGRIHGHDGEMRTFAGHFNGRDKKRLVVALTGLQAAKMLHRKLPEPDPDPYSQSDWITRDAARVRKENGIPSAHQRAKDALQAERQEFAARFDESNGKNLIGPKARSKATAP